MVVLVRRSPFLPLLGLQSFPSLPSSYQVACLILLPLGISSSGRLRHHVNPPDHDLALVLGESLI